MQPTIRTLRYFVTVAETGGVTSAAQALNISQSSVSAAINQLERDFDVQLFVRHHARGLSLTRAGKEILKEARGVLAHYNEFRLSAAAVGGDLRGTIAVGCFLTLAPFIMPELLSSFRRLYPGISVEVTEANQEEILAGMRDGSLEFAVTYDYAVAEDIAVEVVSELPPYIALSANHELAGENELHLSQLRDEPVLLLDLPHTRDYFLSLFRQCEVVPRITHRTQSYEVVRGLVGHGEGVAILNALPRTSETYDGSRVAEVPLTGNLQPTRIVTVQRKGASVRRATRAFEEHVRSHFSDTRMRQAGTLSPKGID